MSIPPIDPAVLEARITQARSDAGRRQTRLLIVALIALSILAAASVGGFLLSYGQARHNGELSAQIKAQGDSIKGLVDTVVSLQKAQADNSANGRALLNQVVAIATVIAGFTDPNSQVAKDQQAKTAVAIKSILAGQQVQNADLARKLGEMAVVLAPPGQEARVRAAVARILAEPAPPITLQSAPALSSPAARATPTPTSRPSPTITPALQIQCPVICPQQH